MMSLDPAHPWQLLLDFTLLGAILWFGSLWASKAAALLSYPANLGRFLYYAAAMLVLLHRWI